MPAHDTATFEIVRHFHSPRAVVWRAWTEAEQLQKWWGPAGCALEVLRFEFRPGGFFHYAMKFADAPAMWGRFNYREIAPGERLLWLNSFANANCGIARAPLSDVCPLEIENAVTFSEQAGATTVPYGRSPLASLPRSATILETCAHRSRRGTAGPSINSRTTCSDRPTAIS